MNKSHQVVLYDKIAQMRAANLPTAHLPVNVLRIEWRVLQARNVKGKLGIRTIQDLLDGYGGLTALYRQCLQETLFRHDIAALQTPRPRGDRGANSPVQAQVRNLARWCRRQGIPLTLRRSHLEAIVRDRGVEAYLNEVKNLPGMSPGNARAMRTALWREVVTNPDGVRRYQELKDRAMGIRGSGHFYR